MGRPQRLLSISRSRTELPSLARGMHPSVESQRVSSSRALVLAAVAAGALYLTGAIALGSPPEATDSPGQVVDWFRDHQDAARIYAWTATFGTLAVAVAIGILRGVLPPPFADVFLLGGAVFIVETALQAWFWAG